MNLKMLVVPFFLLMSIILSVGYIKPSLDDILTKKADIVSIDGQLSVIDTVVAHIDQLDQLIDQNKETESFFLQYLPYTMNQEQFIDGFGFLASQKGLYISDMDVKVTTKNVSSEEENVSPDPSVPARTVYTPKEMLFTGSVEGTYENIKAFFALANHLNRFQKMQSFAIERNTKNGSVIAEVDNNNLKGTFVVTYGFLPEKSVVSALSMPLFTNGELKLTEGNALRSLITDIPLLQKGPSGKPNPFQ